MVGAGQGASSMRRFLRRSFRSLPFGQAMIIPHTSAGRKPSTFMLELAERDLGAS